MWSLCFCAPKGGKKKKKSQLLSRGLRGGELRGLPQHCRPGDRAVSKRKDAPEACPSICPPVWTLTHPPHPRLPHSAPKGCGGSSGPSTSPQGIGQGELLPRCLAAGRSSQSGVWPQTVLGTLRAVCERVRVPAFTE